MKGIQNEAIIEAFQRAAQAFGIKELAAALDKAPSTLYAELNPWGDRSKSKLGLEDAIVHSELTGDTAGWKLAADRLGCSWTSKDVNPNRETPIEELAECTAAFGVFGSVIDNPKATIHELIAAAEDLITNVEEATKLKRHEILKGKN